MPSHLRLKRIADRIRQELSEMIVTGQISDPRLGGLFVTEVTVDREFTAAKIYISSLDGKSSAEAIMNGLQHASGFLRSALSKRIQLRSFPELRFIWDETPENAERIEKLLNSLSENKTDSNNDE